MRKEMHVLMNKPRFWSAIGGVEKHVQEISIALPNRKVMFDVITHSHRQDAKKQEKHSDISIFRVDMHGIIMVPDYGQRMHRGE